MMIKILGTGAKDQETGTVRRRTDHRGGQVSNEQMYLAIGVPIIVNTLFNGFLLLTLRDLWRAELRRVEEVLDARLKHIEESR